MLQLMLFPQYEDHDPQNERLEPLALPPWKRTPAHFKGRLRITPAAKGTTKEEAAKAHKVMIRDLEKDPTRILIYSDGSLLTDQTGRRRVGASHVALRQQHLLFGRRISMSPRAEVFDAEMAGLAWAA